MKQFIEIKPGGLLDDEHIYLPQIRTKSMSIPSLKLYTNAPSRILQVKHPRHDRYKSQMKGIINLDQIQKKGKLQNNCRVGVVNDRKIISLQHEPIDLWKQKYEPDYICEPKKLKQTKVQPETHTVHKSSSLQPARSSEPKLLTTKKSQKNNFLQIKMHLKQEREKSIPDEFQVHKIMDHVKIRKNTKHESLKQQLKIEKKLSIKDSNNEFETIQQTKEDNNNEEKVINQSTNNHRKHYKSLLPTFEKINNRLLALSKQKQDLDSPTKWQIEHHYFEEQDQF